MHPLPPKITQHWEECQRGGCGWLGLQPEDPRLHIPAATTTLTVGVEILSPSKSSPS